MLAETLMALAALAGNTVVAAATTDAWEAARRGFARLLGRGDPDRTKVAEQRLAETREQLTGAEGRIWSRPARRWRSGGRGGWRTCWRRTRTRRLTCAPWCRRSRRRCLPGWCLRPITRSPPGGM